MSTPSQSFVTRLNKFVEAQKSQSPEVAEENTRKFSTEVQEFVPKERWGNVFKWMVGYAVALLVVNAVLKNTSVAAAICRGAEGLSPESVHTDSLAQAIKSGQVSSVEDLAQLILVDDFDLSQYYELSSQSGLSELFIAEGGTEVLAVSEALERTGVDNILDGVSSIV